MTATGLVHPVAGAGFARGAEGYAANRPSYPAGIAGWLRDRLGIAPGCRVVEVGAGTGKFTAALVATGAEVFATDPVPEMLAELRVAIPGVRAEVAAAQALPMADDSVDALVCATAFHWFATPQVIAEFRRVLRPGGTLGLVWNVRDTGVDWVAELATILNFHGGGALREASGAWRDVFPAPGFSALQETAMRYDHGGPPEQVIVGRALSASFIAARSPAARAAVAADIRALIAATPDLAGREQVSFPYVTHAYDCRRLD